MSKALKKDEQVYVPLVRLGIDRTTESAFLRTKVLEDVAPKERSATVDLLDDGKTAKVATSAVHRHVGVAIYAVGDIATEPNLIDPLRRSVLHYCRLLLPHDALRARSVRSLDELKECRTKYDYFGTSHVILIGHGSEDGLHFAVRGKISSRDLGAAFKIEGCVASTFLSLCCKTGYQSFARPFSEGYGDCVFIAPFHSVHGAIASQFVQTYLAHHFLDGRTFKVAYNRARDDVPSGIQFRFWQNGSLKTT